MHASLSCLLLCVALGGAPEDAAPLEVRLPAGEDRVELEATDGGVTVVITSPRGIGRATLVRAGESWPATVTLRLALGDLEGFQLSAEGLHMQSFLGADSTEIERPDAGDDDLPGDEQLQLVIRQAGEGVIEVDLPPGLLEWGPAEMRIQWVDWYR